MNNIYKSSAALIACLLLTHAGPWPPEVAPAGSMGLAQTAVTMSLPMLFAEEAADETATPAGEDPAAKEGDDSLPMAQQIVAGVLTGMLAAIFTLRIVFYRRRKRDPR